MNIIDFHHIYLWLLGYLGLKRVLYSKCQYENESKSEGLVYLDTNRITYHTENCKSIVEEFGTTCEPHSGSKSSLIFFYSYKTDLLYPLACLYS